MVELRASRQTIQLLTLAYASSGSLFIAVDPMQKTLTTIIGLLQQSNEDSWEWPCLGDAIVGLLAFLDRRKDDAGFQTLSYDKDFVWHSLRGADPGNLLFACRWHSVSFRDATESGEASVAAYFSTSIRLRSRHRLLWAEAWSYLCDVMLLILAGNVEGEDEPLALFVAPSICTALDALVRWTDESTCKLDLFHASSNICQAKNITDYHIKCSPWTSQLTSHLRILRVSSGAGSAREENYRAILRERVDGIAGRLCERVSNVPSAMT